MFLDKPTTEQIKTYIGNIAEKPDIDAKDAIHTLQLWFKGKLDVDKDTNYECWMCEPGVPCCSMYFL